MADVSHFAFPFRWAGGRALTVVQDSDEELQQGVRVLLLSHRGERVEVPDFGIDDPTFLEATDVEFVAATAAEWDDRLEVSIQETPDEANAMIRHLLVQVSERED